MLQTSDPGAVAHTEPIVPPVAEAPAEAGQGARPFLKWAGGKTRLLPQLLAHVPESMGNYFEPFLGGGAMFFAVRHRVSGRSYLSDLNDELINTWQMVQSDVDGLIGALEPYRDRNSEESYYATRAECPADPLGRAARFMYLNQTAWNGLWRVNRLGEFNVPWGQRPFRGVAKPRLHAARAALEGAAIQSVDYRESLAPAGRGDFAYLDPPYLPLSDTSKFYFYTEVRFRHANLVELADTCRDLSARGVSWVLSNRDTPLVRDLFGDFSITRLTTRRSVAAQNRRDVEASESPEVIISWTK